jgi:hypothetical protein
MSNCEEHGRYGFDDLWPSVTLAFALTITRVWFGATFVTQTISALRPLTFIRAVTDTNDGHRTITTTGFFSWFSTASPGKCRNISNYNTKHHILP